MAPARTPRERWIQEGLDALAAGGPDNVRVDKLARAIGVTRGGFYWHFENRAALLAELLDAWERMAIDDVVERVDAGGGDGRDRLRRLFGEALESDRLLLVDLAVRDWARHDSAVAKRLRRADNRRMDYLREQVRELGLTEDEVEVRCLLMVSLWIGRNFVAADHGGRSREDVLRMAAAWLLE